MKKEKMFKSVLWNAIGMSFSSIVSLILLIFITRLNGIEESGVFSFLFSLSLIIYTITLYGGRVYQVSDYKNEYSHNVYYSLKVITSIISVIVLFLYLIINKFSTIELIIAFLLLFVKIIDAFSDTIYGIFQKNERLDLVGKSLTFKTIFSVLVLICVDYTTKNLLFSVFAYMLVNLVVFIFYDKFLANKFVKTKIQINKQTINLLLSTKFIFLNNFISNVLINIPRFFVKFIYSNTELGYLGILIMIPTVLSLFGQFIVQPILLKLIIAVNKKDKGKFDYYISKCTKYILGISLLCIVAAYLLGPEVLNILYGIDFSNYRLSILILIFAGTFNVLSFIISTALNIFRKIMIQTVAYISTLLISIVLFYFFTVNFTFKIIFIIYLLVMILQFILLYIYYLSVKKKIFMEEQQ